MITGIISIIFAVIAILPCFAPGAISMIGVFLSLAALIISCFSTFAGKSKYLISVLIIVSINIFAVSEFSFALSKNLYSHTQTPLRKAIYFLSYNETVKIREEKNLKALEQQLGHKINVNYKEKEVGYWQFVRMVFLFTIIPYFLSISRLYYLWK